MTSSLGSEPRFVIETIDNQISEGRDLAIGDVDGDGKPDIILVDAHQVVWYRNGDWKRFVIMEKLAHADNACLAVRDTDGDEKVELAVASGAVYYLVRPEDPTQLWTAVHFRQASPARKVQWAKTGDTAYQLVVLPKHPEENIRAFEKPADATLPWKQRLIALPLPRANDLETYNYGDREVLYISGDGGIMGFYFKNERWVRNTADWLARGRHTGEIRIGAVASRNTHVVAAMEPHPGKQLTLYTPGLSDSVLAYDKIKRRVLERKMRTGHGLGMADLLGLNRDQVVAGWKDPNEDGDFGIKLYVPFNKYWEAMDVYWVDKRGIACDDLEIKDMNNDGQPDIIAYGNATRNLKIYFSSFTSIQ